MPDKINTAAAGRWRIEALLGILPDAKPRVYQKVFAATAINSFTYWLEIFFSAGIATLGLVENSPAVIIGAMLISPLMDPIMATGLALAVGDLYLAIRALLNLLASVLASVAFSAYLVWLLPFHSATTEILARTNPNLLDLGIALLSGLAGSVVVSRGDNSSAAIPGVAIAVALMPPLCTAGFGVGSGLNSEIMTGSALLFLTNLVAIVAAAFVVFLLAGLNTAEVRQLMAVSRNDDPLSRLLSRGPLARILSTSGQLRWRILMILVLLGSIAVPLSRALRRVADETIARGAVQQELKHLLPSSAVVSQQVVVDPDVIAIRLISTERIPDSRIQAFREALSRRTGHDVQLTVDAVASKSELADLMARLRQPDHAGDPEPTAEDVRKQLVDRVGSALAAVWPSADAPIRSFDVITGASGIKIDVQYQAAADLGPIPLDMVLRDLRNKLGMPDATLQTENVPPVPPNASSPAAPPRPALPATPGPDAAPPPLHR